MKPTDVSRASQLAGAIFDDQIVRLARARKAAGKQEYFPLGSVPDAETYYQQPAGGAGTAAILELPGDGTAAELLDALAASWRAEGENELVKLVPALQKVAKELESERVEGDGTVDILCYTMF